MAPPAPVSEPPELASTRSLLDVTKLLALIFGALWLLGGVADIAWSVSVACVGLGGPVLAACTDAAYGFGVPALLFGVIDLLVVFMVLPQLRSAFETGQYQVVKQKSLLWAILGLIVGGVIVGILLLVLYLKMDALISWQQSQGGGMGPVPTQPSPLYGQTGPPPYGAPAAPPYGQPAPSYGPPAVQPPPPYSAPTPYPSSAPSPYGTPASPPPSYGQPAPAAPYASSGFATYNPAPTPSASPGSSMPSAGGPACSACGKPTTWVAQYGRYYCYSCSKYA